MTGIERLRELGREQEERSWSKVGKVRGRLMLDIADQIDREQDEHARCQLADYLRVRAVERDMERHVLGHEGMEDSPVARWARELREALGGDKHDHADEQERPESKCRDCAHWQKDPTADNMGVCWFFYHEYEGQDCYPARLGDIGACEEFMPRASTLAERERGE